MPFPWGHHRGRRGAGTLGRWRAQPPRHWRIRRGFSLPRIPSEVKSAFRYQAEAPQANGEEEALQAAAEDLRAAAEMANRAAPASPGRDAGGRPAGGLASALAGGHGRKEDGGLGGKHGEASRDDSRRVRPRWRCPGQRRPPGKPATGAASSLRRCGSPGARSPARVRSTSSVSTRHQYPAADAAAGPAAVPAVGSPADAVDHASAGGALLVANHSGVLPFDAIMLQTGLHDEHPQHRNLRLLCADLVYEIPGLAYLARRPTTPAPVRERQTACSMTSGSRSWRGSWASGNLQRPLSSAPFRLLEVLQVNTCRACRPIVPCAIVGAEEIPTWMVTARALAWLPATAHFPSRLVRLARWARPAAVQVDHRLPGLLVETSGYPEGAWRDPAVIAN